MSNKGMKLKPRSAGRCPECGSEFVKQLARETYCSIHCAVWSRIKVAAPDECWEWQGGLVCGYGAGTFRGKRYRASRIVLAEKLGHALPEGIQALHRCDNRPCCNPNHLFAGTGADNMLDKTLKGRGKSIPPKLKGEAHGRAMLTEEQVMDIWNNRPHLKAMVEKHKVNRSTAYNIMRGKNWRWLTARL